MNFRPLRDMGIFRSSEFHPELPHKESIIIYKLLQYFTFHLFIKNEDILKHPVIICFNRDNFETSKIRN